LSYLLRELSFPDHRFRPSTPRPGPQTASRRAGLLKEHRADHGGPTTSAACSAPFDCEFIPVTHSVPHGFATRVPHRPRARFLHTRRLQGWTSNPVDGPASPTSPSWAPSPQNEGHPAPAVRTPPTPTSTATPAPRTSVGKVRPGELFHAPRGAGGDHHRLPSPSHIHRIPADRRCPRFRVPNRRDRHPLRQWSDCAKNVRPRPRRWACLRIPRGQPCATSRTSPTLPPRQGVHHLHGGVAGATRTMFGPHPHGPRTRAVGSRSPPDDHGDPQLATRSRATRWKRCRKVIRRAVPHRRRGSCNSGNRGDGARHGPLPSRRELKTDSLFDSRAGPSGSRRSTVSTGHPRQPRPRLGPPPMGVEARRHVILLRRTATQLRAHGQGDQERARHRAGRLPLRGRPTGIGDVGNGGAAAEPARAGRRGRGRGDRRGRTRKTGTIITGPRG